MGMIRETISDLRGFTAATLSVIIVMLGAGLVVPHISIVSLGATGLIGVSLLTLSFFLARSFTALIHSSLLERNTPRQMGTMSLTLLALTYWLYFIAPPIYYPVVKILEGFTSGLFWPMMQSILVTSVSRKWRSTWMSIYFILGNFSMLSGIYLGSIIIAYWTAKPLIPIGLTIIAFFIPIYYLAAPKWRPKAKNKGRPRLMEALKETGRLAPLLPIILLMGGVNGLLRDYLFSYAKIVTGYGEKTIRFYWSLAGYIGEAAALLLALFYESTGREKTTLTIGTVLLSAVILIPFARGAMEYFTVISLAIIGARVMRPLMRGLASNKASRPEHGIAYVNSIANLSAGFTPFIVAIIQAL